MKKIALLIILLVTMSIASVHGQENQEDFSRALEIIENKVPCENLTDSDFDILGDYYMELMHPGEAHEQMDAMMGGEGSESLEIMHINMGKRFYCDDYSYARGGLMGAGIMGGRMMGSYGFGNTGMMQFPYTSGFWSGYSILNIVMLVLFLAALVLLIVWLYKNTLARKNPKEVLKMRLAEGRISKKEYDELKREL